MYVNQTKTIINQKQKIMKKFKWLLLLAAFVTPLFFVSCSSDDDDDDNGNGHVEGNHFTYDGNTYDLSQGLLIYYGQWYGDGFNFDVDLYSDGIEFPEDEEEWASGSGYNIYFEFFSPEESDLIPGTYVFDEEETGDPYTFHFADFSIDINFDDYSGTFIEIIGGTVEVAKSGSNYILTIEVIAEDNKPVTGYYNGPLMRFDDDDWDKSGEMTKKRRF